MDAVFEKMAANIIKEQQLLIGPVALEVAKKIKGLDIQTKPLAVTIAKGDEVGIMNNLVIGYKSLFGQASVEVCKDAVRSLLSSVSEDQVPELLR